MDTISFLSNVIAGIVASAMTLIVLSFVRRNAQKKRFSQLEGIYDHFTVEGEPLMDGSTEIQYVRGRLLTTKGYVGIGEWEGRIIMNEDVPEYGIGIYQYLHKPDCGVHQIQVNWKEQSIYVHGTNTSHGQDRLFAYIWKKKS